MSLSTQKNLPTAPVDWPVGHDPRRKANVLQRGWYFLTLRPYGNDLLTRSGGGYLILMSLVMFLVAFAEALAWGNFGKTFIVSQPLLGGIGLGVFIFLLMWSFDRSLMTFDLMQQEHQHTLHGKIYQPNALKESSSKPWWALIWEYKSFVFRLGLIVVSIVVTAPFLTQLVFNADIQNYQNKYFHQAVAVEKDRVIAQLQADQDKQSKRIEQTTAKLQQEMSGSGGSRMFGYGINAQAIQNQITAQEDRLNQLYTEQRERVTAIEQAFAAQDFAQLAGLGIVIDQDSPILRGRAVDELKKDSNYWQTEIAVIALLLMLLVIMFSMKMMQPRNLKLYFSSRLQEQWNLYCLGKYDEHLATDERRQMLLNSQDALPEEFERIMLDYAKNQNLHEQQRQRQAEQQAAQYAAEQAEQAQQRAAEQAKHAAAEQRQRDLQQAETAYLSRLAEEKSSSELRMRQRDFEEQQIEHALSEISLSEQQYRSKHQTELDRLTATEEQLASELHDQQKIYKTHAERSEARRQRILDGEQELRSTQARLQQLRSRDDSDRAQVLRIIEDLELGTMRQTERLAHQNAELMGFELTQRCYEENQQQTQLKLSQSRQRLQVLSEPLDAIIDVRAKVESRQIRLTGEQGLMDSPFVPHDSTELPLMVEKLRQQLATHLPNLPSVAAASLDLNTSHQSQNQNSWESV